MSGSSSQRLCKDRRAEASLSCRQGVGLLQKGVLGTIAAAQVTADQQGDVEGLLQAFHPLLLQILRMLIERGRVHFNASAEQPVQRGRPNHSAVVGQA
ncbi:hypothetical protein ACOSQ3_018813 [Xanthoceras sorbifolium]